MAQVKAEADGLSETADQRLSPIPGSGCHTLRWCVGEQCRVAFYPR